MVERGLDAGRERRLASVDLHRLVLLAAALFAAAAFVCLHVLWPLSLPPAWNDEIHFLVPALNVAASGLPRAPELMSPEGIFWLPSGMYFLNGAVFAALGEGGIRIARAVAFVEIVAAALILRAIARDRLASLPGAEVKATLAALAWFVCLPVVIASDMARPEAPALALSLAAVLCLLRGAALGATAFATLAALVHPLLGAPAVVAVGAGLALGPLPGRPRAWEWTAAAAAAALLAFEAALLATHFDVYVEQWRFQLARKAERDLLPAAVAVASGGAAVLLWALARRLAPADRPARRACATTAALGVFGFGCLGVQFYGQEMWYWPFAVTGVWTLGLAFAPALASVSPLRPLLASTSAFALLVALALGTWALALRDRGFLRFTAWPERLATLAADREAVVQAVHGRLTGEGARLVLVTPFYWDDLRRLTARDGGPEYRSWTPFGTLAGAPFDHAVLLASAYAPLEPAGAPQQLPAGAPPACGPAERVTAGALALDVARLVDAGCR